MQKLLNTLVKLTHLELNNMQENIKTIRKACIKANPGIVELKFGCQIQRFHETGPVDIWVHLYNHGSDMHTVVLHRPKNPKYVALYEFKCGREEIESWVILGRPIRLADIVLATIKKMDGKTNGEVKDVMLKFAYLWDCFHDDLTQQPTETLEFIANLLK